MWALRPAFAAFFCASICCVLQRGVAVAEDPPLELQHCVHDVVCGDSGFPGLAVSPDLGQGASTHPSLCVCRGKTDPSRCYRGTCDQRTPPGRGPEFDPSKGGDGDATFAMCAFFETMDHEVDERSCDQKVEQMKDPQLNSFTEPPRRDYEATDVDGSLPVGPQEEADISMEAARLVGKKVRASQVSRGNTMDHSD